MGWDGMGYVSTSGTKVERKRKDDMGRRLLQRQVAEKNDVYLTLSHCLGQGLVNDSSSSTAIP